MDNNQPKQFKVETVKVKPKFLAQGCPVCNTWGTLRHGTIKCQACEGKGYILIPCEEITNGRTDYGANT